MVRLGPPNDPQVPTFFFAVAAPKTEQSWAILGVGSPCRVASVNKILSWCFLGAKWAGAGNLAGNGLLTALATFSAHFSWCHEGRAWWMVIAGPMDHWARLRPLPGPRFLPFWCTKRPSLVWDQKVAATQPTFCFGFGESTCCHGGRSAKRSRRGNSRTVVNIQHGRWCGTSHVRGCAPCPVSGGGELQRDGVG